MTLLKLKSDDEIATLMSMLRMAAENNDNPKYQQLYLKIWDRLDYKGDDK